MKIFISYSHRDGRILADRLSADLEAPPRPFTPHKVWIDRQRLRLGEQMMEIEYAICDSQIVLALLSDGWYDSPICRGEYRFASDNGVRVVPIRIQPLAKMPVTFGDPVHMDFSAPALYERNLITLLEDFERDPEVKARRPSISTPVAAAALPTPCVKRKGALQELVGRVMAEAADASAQVTAVVGPPGFGKSTLALALCHERAVQRAFPDGIAWTQIGPEPVDLAAKIRDVLQFLGERDADAFKSIASAAARLRAVVADRAVLIVVDDVWTTAQLEPFRMPGMRARTVFTTRNQGIAFALGVQPFTVNVFGRDESIELLRRSIGHVDPTLGEIAARLGEIASRLGEIAARLGDHPFAISVAAAQLLRDPRPKAWLEEYRELADLELHDGNYTDLGRYLDVVIRRLETPYRGPYIDLATFPPATRIPISTAARLLRSSRAAHGAGGLRVHKLLETLAGVSLLDMRHGESVALHGLMRDHLRQRYAGEVMEAQQRFLDSYQLAGSSWCIAAEDDDYLQAHLAYHLADAGRLSELRALLLDVRWLALRLRGPGSVSGLLADFEFLGEDSELRVLHAALRLAEAALASDSSQLAGQLLGRLADGLGPGLDALLESARKQPGTWLRPLVPTLHSPQGCLKQTLHGHSEGVSAIRVGGDGRWLLSGSEDGTLKIWDVAGGREHRTMAHGASVKAIDASSTHAVSGSDDGSVKVWNLEDGACEAELLESTVGVKSVVFTPDGLGVVAGYDDGVVRIWSWPSGSCETIAAHTAAVRALSLSDDGKLAASGAEDGSVKLWDLQSRAAVAALKMHNGAVSELAFIGSDQIASSSWDGTVRVWERTTGRARALLHGHANAVTSFAASRDGKTIVSGSADDTLMVWNVPDVGAAPLRLIGHTAWVRDVAFVNRSTVASAADDGTIGLWDLDSSPATPMRDTHVDAVTSLAFLHGSRRAVSASADSTLMLWDVETAVPGRGVMRHESHVTSVVVCPNGRVVSASDDHTIRIWDDHFTSSTTLTRHIAPIKALAVAGETGLIVSGSADHTIMIWDQDGARRRTLIAHSSRIRAVACTADGRHALSASADGALLLWDLETDGSPAKLRATGPAIKSIAILPGERVAVTGADDGVLALWDLDRRSLICSWKAHAKRVNAVATAGRTIVSASSDKMLAMWQRAGNEDTPPQRIAMFMADSALSACAIDAVGEVVAVGDQAGAAHFLAITPGSAGSPADQDAEPHGL